MYTFIYNNRYSLIFGKFKKISLENVFPPLIFINAFYNCMILNKISLKI